VIVIKGLTEGVLLFLAVVAVGVVGVLLFWGVML